MTIIASHSWRDGTGRSWNRVSTPVPSWAHGVYFTSVDAISSADVWAVGYGAAKKGNNYDEPVVERWFGKLWNIITTPKLSGDGVLRSVSGAAENDAWACGSRPRVTGRSYGLIEHWNGKHWKIVSGPNAVTQLNGVDAISKDDVWAVGVSGSIPQYDSDSGLTFSRTRPSRNHRPLGRQAVVGTSQFKP